jgi:hypothetical protein
MSKTNKPKRKQSSSLYHTLTQNDEEKPETNSLASCRAVAVHSWHTHVYAKNT